MVREISGARYTTNTSEANILILFAEGSCNHILVGGSVSMCWSYVATHEHYLRCVSQNQQWTMSLMCLQRDL
jgi:hypothetical protein